MQFVCIVNFACCSCKYRRREMKALRMEERSIVSLLYAWIRSPSEENVIKSESIMPICALCMWISCRSGDEKQGYTPHILILYFLLLTSLVSVLFSLHTRAQLNARTQKCCIHTKIEIQELCVGRKRQAGEKTSPGASLHFPVFLCGSLLQHPCPLSLPWHKWPLWLH